MVFSRVRMALSAAVGDHEGKEREQFCCPGILMHGHGTAARKPRPSDPLLCKFWMIVRYFLSSGEPSLDGFCVVEAVIVASPLINRA